MSDTIRIYNRDGRLPLTVPAEVARLHSLEDGQEVEIETWRAVGLLTAALGFFESRRGQGASPEEATDDLVTELLGGSGT